MATTLQLRRGNTATAAAVTGLVGEIYVDTDKKTLRVHDGSTAGGTILATEGFVTTASRTSVSVTDSGGDGSLSYNNTSGVFTYTGPSATEVRAHFSAGTGITITSGSIATSITQYTDTLARAAVSVTDAGGDGSLSYNNTSGVFTYTGPSATEVRAHFSAGTGITITSGSIATSITQYTDALARGAVVKVVPTTAKGASGDLAGTIAGDASFLYFCHTSYTDGVADIWSRVAIATWA